MIARLLPPGTKVYVNHLPLHSLDHSYRAVMAVHEAGLEPVPHLAARRLTSAPETAAFIRKVVEEAGVKRALLIGGDLDRPEGPFIDTLALLSTSIVADAGLREVSFAAYPDQHPRIAKDVLRAALDGKIQTGRKLGLSVDVVTQFSFSASRICALLADLQLKHQDLPVTVGIAGPASPLTLLRLAKVCGVSASTRMLASAGLDLLRLATKNDPGRQLQELERTMDAGVVQNVAGIHLFSFGGASAAARWLQSASRWPQIGEQI